MASRPLLAVATMLAQIIMLFSSTGNCTVAMEEDDVKCLKLIKESLQDPDNYLTSWNFNLLHPTDLCKFAGISCWNDRDNRIFGLDLSYMGLRGNFPSSGIEFCASLQTLNLSNNELRGSIPSDVCHKLNYITSVDISNNKFSGKIPVSLANCYYLNRLLLDGNQFSGKIPEGIGRLTRLQHFSVANNRLVGAVPAELAFGVKMRSEWCENNEGLCGGPPLKPCKKLEKEDHLRRRSGSWFMTGFGVGFFVFAILVCVWGLVVDKDFSLRNHMKKMFYMFSSYERRKRKRNIDSIQLSNGNLEISTLERLLHPMHYSELCEATNNFSKDNIIGHGKTGTMYQGNLPTGCSIAIKTIDKNFKRQFINEAMILARFRHNNIIPILGFCKYGTKNNILVYKFMSRGNLYDWLHCEEKSKTMVWPLRVKVAVGLARGLVWLHHFHNNFLVVHLNLCSKCILLDKHFEPKILNFGGALLINDVGDEDGRKRVKIFDYLAKKDVYCFGIVVLELITGLVSVASNGRIGTSLKDLKDHILSKDFSDCFKNGVNVDNSIMELGFEGDILCFLGVVRSCVQGLPERRPTMVQVYKRIMSIGKRYGLPYDSEISRLLVLKMKSSEFDYKFA